MSAAAFREARKSDLAAIVAMLADDDLGRGRETSGVTADYARAFDDVAASPDNRIIVAEQDGRVVGCLQLTIIPGLARQGARRGLIEAVRVAVDARGEGVGEAILHAIALAKEAGCRLVQLTSDKRRARAHDFYRRLGFEATHEGFKLELAP
jgi:N-acetylglutamate synthase-like GNAT family acetyltransferase